MPICRNAPTATCGSPPRAWGQWLGRDSSRWEQAVHPHGRGDNRSGTAPAPSQRGSPPRAWGQFVSADPPPLRLRFTPTGVGTIPPEADVVRRRAVHPHGRGDNGCGCDDAARVRGSPPRAWGQFAADLSEDPALRFTPTGVGTIGTGESRSDPAAVHPHGRGDNGEARVVGRVLAGSPPRAWGQCRRRARSARSFAVHPHGRGDNSITLLCRGSTRGSPPRAWGQYARQRVRRRAARFTPTGVGTIPPVTGGAASSAVHPHGRGDNLWIGGTVAEALGSPPRAWGQYRVERLLARCARFTPTGVGTIASASSAFAPASVHPHGRGDNNYIEDYVARLRGSPPRAWGQCIRRFHFAFRSRFTPTGVGTMTEEPRPVQDGAVHPHGRGDNFSLNC